MTSWLIPSSPAAEPAALGPPGGRLVVFAKAPVAGRVKSRLASHYGRHASAGIYRTLLERTVDTAVGAGAAPVELWAAPHRHPFLTAVAARYALPVRVQPPGDLGRRMHRAFLERAGSGGPMVIIGADCAALDGGRIRAAYQALAGGADAAFVPAEDGGYTLVGLRAPQAGLFRGVPWGGPDVMAVTRIRLRRLGLRWVELAPSFDVDRAADFRRLRRAGYGSGGLRPSSARGATTARLRRWPRHHAEHKGFPECCD